MLDLVGKLSRVALENVLWQVRQAHRPQVVAGEVVGLEGMKAFEVVVGLRLCLYTVMRMRMSWVTSNSNTSNSY